VSAKRPDLRSNLQHAPPRPGPTRSTPAFDPSDALFEPDAYPAELYELVHRGTAGDLAFYSRVCAGARRVLELGCGYGRVLEALAREDLALVGLERDPALLARARERLGRHPHARNVRLLTGDMTDFSLRGDDAAAAPEPLDRILIPHSGIYCLPNDEACVACFRRCALHLAGDGLLVFDAYAADAFHAHGEPADHDDESLSLVVRVEDAGVRYDVFERSLWDRARQRLDVTYEYIPATGGPVRLGRLMHRYLLLDQIEPLLARAGLALVALHGDWRGGAPDGAGAMWVATAALRAPVSPRAPAG
jgi:SAM-dependent methyltransferase